MFRRIRNFAAWLVVLIGGLLVIHVLTFSLAWSGSGAGTGIFSYKFRARFHPDYETENGRSIFGSVNVEGSVEPRFKVWGHMSPRYREVEIEWLIFDDSESAGKAVVDLDQMQIDQDGYAVPLTPDDIGKLIGLNDPNSNAVVTALLQFLHSAREGTLPVPNHHGHSLPEPLPGRIHHFAIGPAIRPLGLVWVLMWSVAGLIRLFPRQRSLVGETKQE